MESRPALRLLQVAPQFCANPTAGAELRNYHLGRALARHMEVTHLGFTRPGTAAFSGAGDSHHRFVPVPRADSYRALDLVRGALGTVPFSVLNYTRKEMKHALERYLREEHFDIVLLEGVHVGEYVPLLRRAAKPPRAIVCDWHNIESEVLRRYAGTTGSVARRLYARHAAGKLQAYEREFVKGCDLHITVSERDRGALLRYGATVPVVVVENGVPMEEFRQRPSGGDRQSRFRVLFVGSMDYHANAEGAVFFGREVWPQIEGRLPGAVFTIAGRNPSADVRNLCAIPGVEVTGTVPDVRPYYGQAFAAVVPLRAGGGTRLKILEAMAAGVPVVSTACGAEGLAAIPGTHYVPAETAEAMGDAVMELARDVLKAERLARAGRELVERRYDWAALGEALAAQLIAFAGGAMAAASRSTR